MKTRGYQDALLEAVRTMTVPRAVASMATGLGKGHIAGHLTEALGTNRVLYLAERKELISQLRTHVARIVGWENVGIEKANDRARDWQPCVIGSVDTLRGERLASFDPRRFDAIVVDECHHAVAPKYLAIFRHFGILDEHDAKVEIPPVRLLGLTATPSRGDGIGLHNVFDDIIFRYPIGDAIRDKWLVPVHAFQVETSVVLDGVRTKSAHGDYKEGELGRAINVDARNATVFDGCEKNAPGLKTLVFCATVEHAQAMAAHFQEHGRKSEWIAGTMRDDERAGVLHWYATTPGAVLCNVAIVTEGVDIPSVECVVMARPTKSATLFAQCMGRGTRLADGARDYDHSVELGKSRCVLIDITDSIADAGKRAVRVGDIFGLPLPGADCAGEDVLEVAEQQRLEIESAAAAREVETRAKAVNLFGADALPAFCRLRWHPSGQGLWIGLPSGWRGRIERDIMDRWSVESMQPDHSRWKQVHVAETMRAAVEWAEQRIAAEPARTKLLSRDAEWRGRVATAAALAKARRLGAKVPDGATGGQVSDAIARAEAAQSAKAPSRKMIFAAKHHGIPAPPGITQWALAKLLRDHGAWDKVNGCACNRGETVQ